MKIEWSGRAVTTVRRYMADQPGMVAIVAAIDALAADPHPAEAFKWGEMWRLRTGEYRIMYAVSGDLITIDRIDRIVPRADR